MTADTLSQRDDARQIFAGRIDVLYALGRHYLSLPFAVLCVPATLLAGNRLGFLPVTPLLLQMAVVIAAEQLTAAYRNRPVGSDPHFWARRYTFVSAIAGAHLGSGHDILVRLGFVPGRSLSRAGLSRHDRDRVHRPLRLPARLCRAQYFRLGTVGGAAAGPGRIVSHHDRHPGRLFRRRPDQLFGRHGAADRRGLALRNENADLVVRLQSEKNEAITARDSARASALAKSAFIANISHELRTPMNALLGMAQMLERAELPKQQADHVKVMLEAGRGLQTLLDDVIALTRDDDDALEDEDCDPAQTARAVTRLLQPRAWEKRLRLTLTAAANLPRVAADPRRVRQALLKIADNALKFTERGLVDIRLDLDSDAGGQPVVRFSISDTGLGVAPEVAHLLFKPFSPGDSSYARKEQGAGLGLAVTKRIVEQAGGEIGFESVPGDGALFWFTLPVSGQTGIAATQGPPAETPMVAPHGLSLLISVPAPNVAASLANLLEPFGNRVVIAVNAAEAAARAGQEHFDALIAARTKPTCWPPLPASRRPSWRCCCAATARPAAPIMCCAGR